MATPIVQTLTVEARDIRRGDVFVTHRRTLTATCDAYRGEWDSATVEVEGGSVWFPKFKPVEVQRVISRRRQEEAA